SLAGGAVDLLGAGASLDRDDDAVLEEQVGDLDRGVEDAAGIVAQVEDEAAEAALLGGAQRVDLAQRIGEFGGGGGGGLGESHVGDPLVRGDHVLPAWGVARASAR